MAENILKVNDRLQTRDPWNSESLKYDKYKTKSTSKPIIFTLQKTKIKEKILKEVRKEKRLTYKGIRVRISEQFSSETKEARKE